ncbi:MAG: VTT domain-containing protein [Bacilli bacterium]|nr:VTT domain-containing protein [Bacilli bacterium]
MKYIIYFLLCVLQPICLPVPELTTYLYGEKTVGPLMAFIIGYIGVLTGLTIMYFISYKASKYIIKKFHYEDKIKKLYYYVKKYQIIIICLLFIIPVIPDEVICIGAPVIGIHYIPFIILAIVSKGIAIAMVTFSQRIADHFLLNQWTIIAIEIALSIIATIIFNLIDKRKKQ